MAKRGGTLVHYREVGKKGRKGKGRLRIKKGGTPPPGSMSEKKGGSFRAVDFEAGRTEKVQGRFGKMEEKRIRRRTEFSPARRMGLGEKGGKLSFHRGRGAVKAGNRGTTLQKRDV